MAINLTCGKCGKNFTVSACSYKWLCNECDGTNEAKRKEAERWAALTSGQKCDELLKRVIALEQSSGWDGRIG